MESEDENEYIIKEPPAPHVPEWFKRMSGKITDFLD